MALKTLELINFRSYGRAEFSFEPTLNLIIGPNGAGKTNLLEAVYTLANTKSWRAPDRSLIKDAAPGFKITGQLENRALRLSYELKDGNAKKRMFYNQTPARPHDFFGQFKVVLFEPGSLGIISGAPEKRRAWLDQTLAVGDKNYFLNLVKYRRVLKQRNHLLRSAPRARLADQVFAWDISLVETAGYLLQARLGFINYLNQRLGKTYRALAGQSLKLAATYQSSVYQESDPENYASALLKKLGQSLERDQRFGFTGSGPHRDDLEFWFAGVRAAQVASRGETRTLALALKLIEHQWLARTARGQNKPALLFDDIFSELDAARREFTLASLKGSQIFLTTTDLGGLKQNLLPAHQTIKLAR